MMTIAPGIGGSQAQPRLGEPAVSEPSAYGACSCWARLGLSWAEASD